MSNEPKKPLYTFWHKMKMIEFIGGETYKACEK